MIRKWRNQKEIPTPQTEGWEKTKVTLRLFIPRKHIVSRVSSNSTIGGHSVSRTYLKYKQNGTTTEVSPWNDQYYKITGVLTGFTGA